MSTSYLSSPGREGISPPLAIPLISFTRPANTTAYAANTVVTAEAGGPFQVAIPFPTNGRLLLRASITDYTANATPMSPQLWLFAAQPTALNDGSVLNFSDADLQSRLCIITPSSQNSTPANASVPPGTLTGSILFDQYGLTIPLLADGTGTLWGYVVTTVAFTPLSGEKIEILLGVA